MRARDAGIDQVKALAILAVILTHSATTGFLAAAYDGWDWYLCQWWTGFHVPSFILVGGRLARADTVTWRTIAQRLDRLIRPYLIATAVLYATGLAPFPGWARLPRSIVLAADYGIYYYVPMFALCTISAWLIARMSERMRWAVLVLLLAYGIWEAVDPLVARFFWRIRDPFGRLYFALFLMGWLGIPWRLPVPPTAWGALAVGILFAQRPFWVSVVRTVQAVSVTGLLSRNTWNPQAVQLLSSVTLGLYLWHRPCQQLLTPFVLHWPSPLRIAVLFSAGLSGGLAVCLGARHLLGLERARRWFGA